VSDEPGIAVTVTVTGEGTGTVELPADATHADLLEAIGLGVHEAAVLADGRPVPADEPVDADRDAMRVLRLIKGG